MPDNHQYFGDPMITRLMTAFTALAGELMVTRAANWRLQRALENAGVLVPGAVEDLGTDPDYQAWLAKEPAAFSSFVMAPFVEPNLSLTAEQAQASA
ncbi:hypothetical protein [Actinophytocola sp.]|uniref:hypothetical protein n=1 Tax=Actinophytocola sp. TaxID=1872138 RepID=UPI003D6A2208